MVVHSVVSDSLASRAACRAGAWPTPAESTLPIQHCSTADESTPAFESAPVIAAAPSCGAVSGARLPLKPPIGVRTALTMQTSRGEAAVARPRRSSERPSIITAPPRADARAVSEETSTAARPKRQLHTSIPPLCACQRCVRWERLHGDRLATTGRQTHRTLHLPQLRCNDMQH